LNDLRTPVLVVGGDRDIITKLEASEHLSRDTPLAELKVVEGVNHMGPLERADVYNTAIADFTVACTRRQGLAVASPERV
jgi:pimeloyl-ACP methyl ester carboxylesterase